MTLHGALALFPGGFTEEMILAQFIKIVAQRSRALKPSADGGE